MSRTSKLVAVSLSPADFARLTSLALGADTAPTSLAAAMIVAAIESTLDNPPPSISVVRSEFEKLRTDHVAVVEAVTQLRRETNSIHRWLAKGFLARIRRRKIVASGTKVGQKSNSVRATAAGTQPAPTTNGHASSTRGDQGSGK